MAKIRNVNESDMPPLSVSPQLTKKTQALVVDRLLLRLGSSSRRNVCLTYFPVQQLFVADDDAPSQLL